MHRRFGIFYRVTCRRWQSQWKPWLDRYRSVVESWFIYEPLKHRVKWFKDPLGIFLLYLSIGFLFYWTFNVPSPGKSVAALAVAAAIMSVRGEMSGEEKVAWILLLFAFLFVELRSIDKEHYANEEDQRALRYDEQFRSAKLLQATISSFNGTTSRLKALNDANQKAQTSDQIEFSSLLSKENDLFKRQEQLSQGQTGRLFPGTNPTPANHCVRVPNNAVLVFVGNNVSVVTEFPHTVLESRSRGRLVTIDHSTDGAITVFVEIRSRDGKIIARMNKDGFVVNRNNFLQIKEDRSNLVVIDEYGTEVLNARYLNPQTFVLSGTLHYPDGDIPLQLRNISNNCTSSFRSSDILID